MTIVLQFLSTLIVALGLTLGVINAVEFATGKAGRLPLLVSIVWFFAAVASVRTALGI